MQAQISVLCDAGHVVISLQVSCQPCRWHTICIVAIPGYVSADTLIEQKVSIGDAKVKDKVADIVML